MTLSAWIRSLTVAAAVSLLAGSGAPWAAPSPAVDPQEADMMDMWAEEDHAVDDDYRPGMHGIDYAAITGPRGPADPGAVPACADPERRGDLRPCVK